MNVEVILSALPEKATACEKWILMHLIIQDMNKKKACLSACVTLRRVQQVHKKYKDQLSERVFV